MTQTLKPTALQTTALNAWAAKPKARQSAATLADATGGRINARTMYGLSLMGFVKPAPVKSRPERGADIKYLLTPQGVAMVKGMATA